MSDLIERLQSRAEFEDQRVLDGAKSSGLVPEVYSGSKTGALLREAAAALEAADDALRLATGERNRIQAKWDGCRAKLEAARAEVEDLRRDRDGCIDARKHYARKFAEQHDRAERLAEALRDVMGWVSTDNYFTDEPMQALARARAALHPTAAQEDGRE